MNAEYIHHHTGGLEITPTMIRIIIIIHHHTGGLEIKLLLHI
ncbi:hypothetical protein AZO1586I_431 [Bathymodiolus thermophilus thioautotrophic gill symbiont]|uniref:Uncharacterized protein n=1 Tax=Bathymodiolus thermophilus thioautotrophic gill symbiont TaxID=2360 RepID=A0ABM8M677_9GAMM|nr:hypothetical protein AZO1586I_431 [Bathymodiolus thermophilus thioautotrophic gill symbiont]CAC9486402.1 hypothetical protein [uncultured Gammaproteobacteria bacterium]CAC9997638.1 hypothetical protein [uncultured Gammaproteobacteria bacterium]CAC9999000.1 hypothetical protein [uncultured Gammaproteobacteria bacterium]